MSKIILEFDTDVDSTRDINAAFKSSILALCIWEMQERVRKEWDKCDEGSDMQHLINDVYKIVENRIGNIEDYTE